MVAAQPEKDPTATSKKAPAPLAVVPPVPPKTDPGTFPSKTTVGPEKSKNLDGIRKKGDKVKENPERFREISPEKLFEVHNLSKRLIKVLGACEMVLTFFLDAGGLSDNQKTQAQDIENLAKNIDRTLLGGRILTLEEILTVDIAIKKLTLDIQRMVALIELTPNTPKDELVYKNSLEIVTRFANEDAVVEQQDLSANDNQQMEGLTKKVGIKILRPQQAENRIVNREEPSPSAAEPAAPSPEEVAQAIIERNLRMFDRADAGENITLDTLLKEGYTEGEANDFLKLL